MRNDVRERRLGRGLSQAELAKAVSVSRQTINSIGEPEGKYVRPLHSRLPWRDISSNVEEMFDADH